MWTFIVELDGKRSGRQSIGGSILWHLGDVLEREWLSRRLVRRLETPRHLSRCNLCHRTHTVALFRRHLLLRAFCPTYVRTERLYQFLDLQQRDSTVVQYRARFVELGRYAPQIMADESLRTQQFVRGLRPELRQALIVVHVTDLDVAYQTAAALEVDTLQTRARSVEVQTHVVPIQPRQQQSSVQATPKATTSYASTSVGTTAKDIVVDLGLTARSWPLTWYWRPAMWTFVVELDGKRSGRQSIGGSSRRRGGSSSTPAPDQSSHSGVGAP
ncbi:hypothetical protein Taro_036976 [Colocasia esculenta]|uniref:Retrotransposon gag domain-containing protein n=1 Tax=Colocasia esculenta TaxID=4460 RepID=A0A843VZ47_COLES|nr:hypothetical protein [Colocasia esculenta]